MIVGRQLDYFINHGEFLQLVDLASIIELAQFPCVSRSSLHGRLWFCIYLPVYLLAAASSLIAPTHIKQKKTD